MSITNMSAVSIKKIWLHFPFYSFATSLLRFSNLSMLSQRAECMQVGRY